MNETMRQGSIFIQGENGDFCANVDVSNVFLNNGCSDISVKADGS